MKKGAGKQKGSGFEREVCKSLSLWMTHGKRDDIFWRTAMSGGRATISSKRPRCGRLWELSRRGAQVGDICAIHPLGHALTSRFLLECKYYKNLSIQSFFMVGEGLLTKFWQELNTKAEKAQLIPLLFARQNLVSPFIVTTTAGLELLGVQGYVRATARWGAHVLPLEDLFRFGKPCG